MTSDRSLFSFVIIVLIAEGPASLKLHREQRLTAKKLACQISQITAELFQHFERVARVFQSALNPSLVFDHSEQVFSITREVQNDVVTPRVDCTMGLNCRHSVRIQKFSTRQSA